MHKKQKETTGTGPQRASCTDVHHLLPLPQLFWRFTVMWRVLSVSVCSALVFASAATAPTDVPAGLTNDAWTNGLQASSCRCIPSDEITGIPAAPTVEIRAILTSMNNCWVDLKAELKQTSPNLSSADGGRRDVFLFNFGTATNVRFDSLRGIPLRAGVPCS